MDDHFITYCKYCRKVMGQCRCPSLFKQAKWGICQNCEGQKPGNPEMLVEAEGIAREAHKYQKRWGGAPYIMHPAAVALSFKDDEFDYKIVAWLHDVIEDTDYTHTNLMQNGISEYLVGAVLAMTKKEGQNYYDFIMQISENELASRVKLADIKHNLSDLKEGSLKDKYRLALHILETFIKHGPQ